MSEIFREVDEEVRHEQLLKLWRTYGGYVAAIALAVVLGVGGSVGWKQYQTSQRLVESEKFIVALDLLNGDKPDQAAESFAKLAADAGAGYVTLARLREVQSLAAAGDREGAVAVLDRLSGDGDVEPVIRDLAALLSVLHLMESADAGELDRRLEPLLREESTWRATARELSGLVAFRRGEISRAREIFSDLSDDDAAPPALRGRAAEILAVLGGRPGGDG